MNRCESLLAGTPQPFLFNWQPWKAIQGSSVFTQKTALQWKEPRVSLASGGEDCKTGLWEDAASQLLVFSLPLEQLQSSAQEKAPSIIQPTDQDLYNGDDQGFGWAVAEAAW